MRISGWILTAVMAATLALAGCSKQGSSIDTSALENSFKPAEASLKDSADKAVAAIKSADYAGALAELKKLADNAKLTPEQKQAIQDVMAQVQKAIADATGKATEEAGKALEGVQKGLPK
jgi:uncharacterized lipoprotein YajG